MKLGMAILILASSVWAQTFDGPAELPRTIPATTAVSPNAPIVVPAGGNLQAAVSAAVCGDTIQYDPAGIFTTSTFILPSIATCDAQHWITIDLKGGKIVLAGSSGTVKGGIFVRLANGEITRIGGTGVIYNLISPGSGAHDLIFDNLYVHGTLADETVRGFELSNTYNVAIINSRITEFHCLAVVGSCTDSQTINGGLDTIIGGCCYLIQNNVLEASGENILFGGGAASFVPSDVTITGNTIYKPDSWNQNDPAWVPIIGKDGLPHPWIVKNLVELKNCRRCLIEHNTMRGSWGGFSQTGFAVLFTPKNQNNGCPACLVSDATFSFNRVSHTGATITMGCGPSDVGGWPSDCGRYSVHDNVWDDLQFPGCGGCYNYLIEIASSYTAIGAPPPPIVLHDWSFTNNSLFLSQWTVYNHGFLLLAGPPAGQPQITNGHFDNNLVPAGTYSIYGAGGAAADCATAVESNYFLLIPGCWTGNSTFSGNVITTPGTKAASAKWPAGNYVLAVGPNVN